MSHVRASSIGPVATGALAFRYQGALCLSVAVKATFALVHEGRAALRSPVDLNRTHVSFDRDPAQSLQRATDLVPYRSSADVTFVGHAYAPPGRAVPAMAVRVALYRGSAALLHKTLHVFGDRLPSNPAAPAPFQRIPLRYERAYGGPAHPHNPMGTGADPDSRLMPNVIDPQDPRRPAGFGPVPASWIAGAGVRGPLGLSELEAPVVLLPDDVAWETFHAAPPDQRVPFLHGDEWIVLDGLHPALPRVQTQLPSVQGMARITLEGPSTARREQDVQLVADTLAIDGDVQGFSIVWRGTIQLAASDEDFRTVTLAGGLQIPGQAPPWEEARVATRRPGPALDLRGTVLADASPSAGPMLPFEPALASATAGPSAVPPAVPRVARNAFGGTVGLSMGEQVLAAQRPALPFGAQEPATVSPPVVSSPPPPVQSTEPASAEERAPALRVLPRRATAIPVLNRTPFYVVTVPWQVRPPQDSIAVIVKGSFDLVAGAAARAAEETALPSGDVHRDDDPNRSLAYASDFAVFKPKADVLLTGHAVHGSSGAVRVVFRFGHSGNGFERAAAVFGDRIWQSTKAGVSPGPPRPFDRIPLSYEEAFGGSRFDANPVGVGQAGQGPSTELPALPRLEDPAHLITRLGDAPAPVCFAPIPVLWKDRWSRLGTYDGRWLKTRWPYFPEDFDWGYFQAAPSAQQLAYLTGDEPFEIVGMHADHAVLRGSLPGIRVRCVLQRTEPAGSGLKEVTLRLDTASFDVDAMKLHLVWRGLVEVSDEDAPEIASLLVTQEALTDAPASLSQVLIACLAMGTKEPVDLPPEPPANDEKPEDPELVKLRAETDQRIQEAREKLKAAGIPEPDPTALPPPAPLGQTAESLAESLRKAKVDEKEIAKFVDSLREVDQRIEEQKNPPSPVDVRAKVKARLEAGEPLDGMDLAFADLSKLDFSGRSLTRTILKDARLVSCNFDGANLASAQVSGADLSGASLVDANLEGADFHGAKVEGATLEGARLGAASFAGATGEGASFRGCRGERVSFADGAFAGARFDDAMLPSADFSRATLDRASFLRAALPDVRLFEAKAKAARFDGATMPRARADEVVLTACSLDRVDASGSIWETSVLEGSTFLEAKLREASFVRARCDGAVFSGADLRDARFIRAHLVGARFLKANLMKASLERADLTSADLRASNLHEAETWKATLDKASIDLALVTGSKLEEPRGTETPGPRRNA